MTFGEQELALARRVKAAGGHLVHDYSENIRGIPVLEETKALCDKFACCSTVLRFLESQKYGDKAQLIRDPYEETPVLHNPFFKREKLKVVWCGMGGNARPLDNFLRPIIAANDMEYVEISNRPQATVPWDKDTWQQHMAACDISLCPQDHWNFPAKSNVKVTTSMALGLPVLASPIESYKEIIESGVSGYICHTLEDWDKSLKELKSQDKRISLVKEAYKKLGSYSPEAIYKEWLKIFKSLNPNLGV